MSPYKDKVLQREAVKKAVQKHRVLQEGITKEGITSSGITEYHPIMRWLIPGEKRDKLERIVQSLKRHNVLRNSYLGCGVHSLPLDVVAEMLEVTR